MNVAGPCLVFFSLSQLTLPLAEFFNDPAVRHHDMMREYDHAEAGRLRVMGQPLVFRETPTRDPGPPPTLGEHTDEILAEAGYTRAEIEQLRRDAVI